MEVPLRSHTDFVASGCRSRLLTTTLDAQTRHAAHFLRDRRETHRRIDLHGTARRCHSLDWTGDGRKGRRLAERPFSASGPPTVFSPTACELSKGPTIHSSPPRSKTSSASTWTHLPMPSSSPSTRSRKSRRSTAHNRGLPIKPGKCGTMTHDYKRNGTTTLFAALNVLDGTVLGRCVPHHRHQEFIKFLAAVESNQHGCRIRSAE